MKNGKTTRFIGGYVPRIEGVPDRTLKRAPASEFLAVCPVTLPFVKPRLLVDEGDEVRCGDPLFTDKKRPELQFLSPGAGTVSRIVYGPRRVIERIEIRCHKSGTDDPMAPERTVFFPTVAEGALKDLPRSELIRLFLEGGIWHCVRAFPYRTIAPTEEEGTDFLPETLIASVGGADPFGPSPDIWLTGSEDAFRISLEALRKLAKTLTVSVAEPFADLIRPLLPQGDDIRLEILSGSALADEPGALLYRIKSSADWNRSWFITGQDILLPGRLLSDGRYPTHRIFAVGGVGAAAPCHVSAQIGTPAADLAPEGDPDREDDLRWIAGGLLTGRSVGYDGSPGYYDDRLILMPEGNDREVLGFVRPGWNRPSYSRAFLSALNRNRALKTDCNTHGEERSCVNCGYCARVCPVDMMPQFVMKAVNADELEAALALGLLDCVECGLCAYVCPSKIELYQTLTDAKAAWRKEMSA